jgi:predicted ferric reductase
MGHAFMKKDEMGKEQRAGNNSFGVRLLFLFIFIAFLSGALSIPFYFETMTLWYKIGIDKTMLRGGQVAGMSALVMFFLQIILAVRGKFLEKHFGRAGMARFHRTNGVVILFLAISHVILVLAPEGITNLPIGKKYWPEMIGIILLLVTTVIVVSTNFRQQLGIKYNLWRTVHKTLGYLVLVLLLTHVLFVSDSFEHSQLRAILILLFGTLFLWVITAKILIHFDKRH